MTNPQIKTALAVVGAGPGGYPAAFHAADLGMEVVLIDREENPGGVCLYRGCIPSKAILHAAESIESARESEAFGIKFGPPEIDLKALRAWKRSVVDKLTGGLGALTRQRNIRYIQGSARFTSPGTLAVDAADGSTVEVAFQNAVIATGSVPVRPGFIPESPLIMDSTDALELACIPERLLVMGGGYIGVELGQAYAILGSAVSVVEMKAALLPGMEARLVKPLSERIGRQFERVMLSTRVAGMKEENGRITVTFENSGGEQFAESYDRVLVAVGRKPVTDGLGLEHAGVETDEHGFIRVDERQCTTAPHIMAVGDIAGHPLLAHKATHEGRAAVEALQSARVYDPRAIPAVVYTDPEIAWCGLTESEASRRGVSVKVGAFPWAASGRAATLNRSDGLTTVVADAESGRILGMGIVGVNAGEMIAEGVLAMEMGAVAEDIALTIHAHPSLSETVMEAAESVMGGSTHFFKRNH